MSLVVSAISILGPILVKVGAPILKRVLEQEIGGTAGGVGSVVIDAIGTALGVPATPEAIADKYKADPEGVAATIRDVEAERDWIVYLASATAARDRMLEREDKRESFFSWGWRPAMSWLLIFLFVWSMVLVPLVNAAAKAGISAPTMADITAFAGIWLVIYGGGHTAKSIWGAK